MIQLAGVIACGSCTFGRPEIDQGVKEPERQRDSMIVAKFLDAAFEDPSCHLNPQV